MKKKTMLKMTILAGLLSFSSMGWAACSVSGGAYSYSRTLPVTTLIVPRDRPYGSPVGDVMPITNSLTSVGYNCSAGYYSLFQFGPALTPSSFPGIYKTNVEGIGIKVWNSTLGVTTVVDNNLKSWYFEPARGAGVIRLVNMNAQYYVIGPVTAGQTVTPNVTVQAWINTAVSTAGGAMYSVLNLTGSAVTAVSACETPNIKVDLKKQDSEEFPNDWSTGPEKQFEFDIKNCGPGMASVSYTFRPGPGITLAESGARQHLTLSNSSTASGVGVQMLYRDGPNAGQLVPFNTKTQFTGYSSAAGGDYSIPMKARYIRTGHIVGGTANSSVEFTMAYE